MVDSILLRYNSLRKARRMKRGMAQVNGTSLYYEIMGNGAPLVLLSGGGTLDRRAWDHQFEVFAKTYQVVRYDIRGIGKSAQPIEAFSHSQDLYELLNFLNVKKAHVMGLSFSGAIALDFALEHPEMVDHLILVATGTSADAKSKSNVDSVLALSGMVKKDGLPKTIELITGLPFFISQDNSEAREKIRQIYLDNAAVFESEFSLLTLWHPTEPPASERLSEIRLPVLIVEGANDHPAYQAITSKLKAGIRGAQQVVISGATHLINMDKPNELNQVVLEFLG